MNRRIEWNAQGPGKPLRHVWSECVGAGRANEGLRADWQSQMKRAAGECGFRSVRFHGLFHDDMFVARRQGQAVAYNWQYVDALFDFLLSVGVRPFVELGFFPSCLAGGDDSIFWWKGRIKPPEDLSEWLKLVREFAVHCRDRYGADEVATWRFEVWNEPNLRDVFWAADRESYFDLYVKTAETLKKVDPRLKVGGPSTSGFGMRGRKTTEEEQEIAKRGFREMTDYLNSLVWEPEWVPEFLEYCQRQGAPVDFVSIHPYPTAWALDGHGDTQGYSRDRYAIHRDLKRIREVVHGSPFRQAEIHCTEWNSSPSPRDFAHDYPQAACYAAMANLEAAHQVDSLAYWTFTDVFEEDGAGPAAFHGGFGMFNLRGVPKPAYHAYQFLNTLGDVEFARSEGGLLTEREGKLAALLYHYPEEFDLSPSYSLDEKVAQRDLKTGDELELELEITGVAEGRQFEIVAVDQSSGWAIPAWHAMGRPASPNIAQIGELQAAAEPSKQTVTSKEGALSIRMKMKPWSVVSVIET
jgi:xylan 1,4-beta-xylosidase